jgi:hypothetical protein
MQLQTCHNCPGLIPLRATACPHCQASVSTASGPLKRLLQVATGGAVAMTLMACYGQPPCEDDSCGEGGYGGEISGGAGGEATTGGQATTGGTGGQATTGGAGGQAGGGGN